ncbi:hypothetical protein HY991_00970 [Candidatus Micrarchaeota archaeon]|nr:hypothetical protein [Candidatus Micrarchaeota archaeon]
MNLTKVLNSRNLFAIIAENYPLLLFFILSLLIMDGLLLPGNVLSLDMSGLESTNTRLQDTFYGINEHWNNGFTVSAVFEVAKLPLYLVISFFLLILPAWVIQKAILIAILFGSAVSAYLACPADKPGKTFAGVLYMINPFLYIRFLAGHWMFLLAYAIAPLAVMSYFRFLDSKKTVHVIESAFLTFLVAVFEIRVFLLLLFLFLLFFFLKVYASRDCKKLLSVSAVFTLVFMLLNLFWLVPLATSNFVPEVVSLADTMLFATKHSTFNVLFNAAALHGFWRGGYLLPYKMLHTWLFFGLFAVILYLAVNGFVHYYRNEKIGVRVKAVAIAGIAALVLAVGSTAEPFKSLFSFLFENIFFFRGFREPHKFLALLAFAYSFLGGLGLNALQRQLREVRAFRFKGFSLSGNKIALVLGIFALLVPMVYTFTMFNGFWGQLEGVNYPKDYYALEKFLNEDPNEFNTLFFPWHMYMDFKWNPKQRIAAPFASFFSKPVIQGDTLESGGIYSQSTNPTSKYIEFLLANKGNRTNFGNLLSVINVKYVVLAKEADYRSYSFLYNQTDLELVKESSNLIVFKNKVKTAKLYASNELLEINDWKELLELSKQTPLNTLAFELNKTKAEKSALNATFVTENAFKYLKYVKKSPTELQLNEIPTKKYVVFTSNYAENWRLDGEKPFKNAGVTNAFEVKNSINGLKITNEGFNYYLIGYGISFITLIILGVYWWRERKK